MLKFFSAFAPSVRRTTGFESERDRKTALLNKVLYESYVKPGCGIPSLAKLEKEVTAKLQALDVGKVIVYRALDIPTARDKHELRVDAYIGDDMVRASVIR